MCAPINAMCAGENPMCAGDDPMGAAVNPMGEGDRSDRRGLDGLSGADPPDIRQDCAPIRRTPTASSADGDTDCVFPRSNQSFLE